MTGKIFINYRREDSAASAGRLHDRLEPEFGEGALFIDVDHIAAGEDFVEVLNAQVAQCDVMLSIIGRQWLTTTDNDTGALRLENNRDFVRIEIEAALNRKIHIIPVLVDGADMPRENELPESLKMLSRRNAVRLTHERFRADSAGLIKSLKTTLADVEAGRAADLERLKLAEAEAAKADRAKEEAEEAQAREAARLSASVAGLSPEEVSKAEELANWDFIKTKGKVEMLRDHLARFPKGVTRDYAHEALEDIVWQALSENPTEEALGAYLEEFPNGVHGAEVKSKLETIEKLKREEMEAAKQAAQEAAAWEAVKESRDPDTLRIFLEKWPGQAHFDEAQRLHRASTGNMTRRWLLVAGGVLAGVSVVGGQTYGPAILLWLQDRTIRTFKGHGEPVTSVAFSPDGRHALSASWDRTLKLWDVKTGELLRTLKGHSGWVRSVVFSPDGRFALSGSDDKTLKLWNTNTGKELRRYWSHEGEINSVAFSPDGRVALSGSDDKTLQLWDVETGKELRSFKGYKSSVTSVAFSPDGLRVLSGCRDYTLNLWDVETGKLLRSFKGHKGPVHTVAFPPNGRFALSGSFDKTLKLWDMETGKELRSFRGHTDYVDSVSFSPDGHRALSGSSDKTLKLWDVETGKELRTFKSHGKAVTSVAFSPDGRFALSGSKDQTLKLWDLSD